jgi:WD40 repeat protein
VTSAAFSPDGAQVVAGSMDGTARLWCRRTGECLWLFEGHATSVISAFFSPDGASVLTRSHDGSDKLWSCSTGECIRTLHEPGLGRSAWSPWVA